MLYHRIISAAGLWLLLLLSAAAAEPPPDESRVAERLQLTRTETKHAEFFSRISLPSLLGESGEAFLFVDAREMKLSLRATPGKAAVYTDAPWSRGPSSFRFHKEFEGWPQDVILSRRDGMLRVYVQRSLVLAVDCGDDPIAMRVYADKAAPVKVQKVGAYVMTDDFARVKFTDGNIWAPTGGDWRVMTEEGFALSPNPFGCRAASREGEAAVAVAGHAFLGDLRLSAAIQVGDAQEHGVLFGYLGEKDHFKAVLTREGSDHWFVLARVGENGTEVLQRRRFIPVHGNWYRITVEAREDRPITAAIDQVKLELPGQSLVGCYGKVGLRVAGGTAMFDDIRVETSPSEQPDSMVDLAVDSRAYGEKEYYEKDRRDDHLHRWARSADAWIPATVDFQDRRYAGYQFHLPLMSDFVVRPQDDTEERLLYLKTADGGREVGIPLKGRKRVRRRGQQILVDDQQVAVFPKGTALVIGYYADAPEGALVIDPAVPRERPESTGNQPKIRSVGLIPGDDGLNFEQHERVREYLKGHSFELPAVSARHVHEELFETAPVDWLQLSGQWKVASRWQCEGQFGFYSGTGTDAAIQISKFQCAGDQVHEFYFGMKDLFGREYSNRMYGRHDVNFSFMISNGDLFSGYTFMFGGFSNRGSYLLRGDRVVAENPDIRFHEFVDIDDLHLFWQKIRCERIGNRIRVLLDRQVVIDYVDDQAEGRPTGGQVALWTYRNGIVFARMTSSAAEIGVTHTANEGDEKVPVASAWQAKRPGLVQRAAGEEKRIRFVNRFSGGELAAIWRPDEPVDLARTPVLEFPVSIPEGTKVNLHVTVNGKVFMLPLTAPVGETYRLLDEAQPGGWKLYVSDAIAAPRASGRPQKTVNKTLRIDLLKEVKRCFPDLKAPLLTQLVIGNTSHHDYLMAGRSGNKAGAWYEVGKPRFAR